jgi:Leucine-rich repeat (LRR) protein
MGNFFRITPTRVILGVFVWLPIGIVLLFVFLFFLANMEYNRVAPDERAVHSWLSTKEGVSFIKERPGRHLTHLTLTSADVKDEELPILARLSKLRRLELGGTRITDRGIKHLCGITSLELLDLSDTKITDAGLADLERLPNLEYVNASNTSVTREGISKLNNLLFQRMEAEMRATDSSSQNINQSEAAGEKGDNNQNQ